MKIQSLYSRPEDDPKHRKNPDAVRPAPSPLGVAMLATGGGAGSGSSGITVGTTTITSGANTKVLFNNSGVVGEYTISGSGSVAMTTSPTFVTPVLGVASATSLATTGTAGGGFVEFLTQSSAPAAPASGFREFADSSGRKSWIRASDGFTRTWDATLTANRVWTMPDVTTTIAGLGVDQTFTGLLGLNPSVSTGTGTTSGLNATANSLTTGDAFTFSSSSVTSGNIVKIASTSTAAASNTLTGLNIAISGANASSGQTVRGAIISVTNTNATSGTNTALTLTASGATTANTALNVTAGTINFTSTGLAISFPASGTTSIAGGGQSISFSSGLGGNIGLLASLIGIGATDLFIRRSAAANLAFGAADAASPVAQTISVQGGTGTNTNGVAFTIKGSLGTSQGVPGVLDLQTGALIAASGTTGQTAVSRSVLGATKVLANNTTTTVVNVTNASNTAAGGIVDYAVEVFDGTDLQIETGSFTYQVTNKGGTIANNTITAPTGFPKNVTTSGTLTVTWAISAANPALLSVNANSSLTPSTGYPRITYTIRNLTQQAIAIQ